MSSLNRITKKNGWKKPLILQIFENKEELLTCSKKVHWHNQVYVIKSLKIYYELEHV